MRFDLDASTCVCRVDGGQQDLCLAKQSMDNMSLLVIAFKGAWKEGAGHETRNTVLFINLCCSSRLWKPDEVML